MFSIAVHTGFVLLLFALIMNKGLAQNLANSSENEWADSDDWGGLQDETKEFEQSPWQLQGFAELGWGQFASRASERRSQALGKHSLQEARTQLSASRYFEFEGFGEWYFSSKLELLYDDVADQQAQLTFREFYLDKDIGDNYSVRLGQQVLTWGTGDFVFLNDFFPKDWQSMLSGRDDEYLKAPSVAIKFNAYLDELDIDLVWQPTFHSDRYIRGERFAYYQPLLGAVSAEPRLRVKENNSRLNDGQLALRLSRRHKSVEYAAYAYHGPYTQPVAYDTQAQALFFPDLSALGASVRGPLAGGIANAEFSYWHSRDDSHGRSPHLPNRQIKYLLGFEREWFKNFTVGGQWFAEQTLDLDNESLPTAEAKRSAQDQEWHHTLTLRLNYNALSQKLTMSLFVFYSPDQDDVFLKPKLEYRHDDHWRFTLGANDFYGQQASSQWGQFEAASNVYMRLRYHF